MKKLAFSLICANVFASNFVSLDIYGSRVAEENGVIALLVEQIYM